MKTIYSKLEIKLIQINKEAENIITAKHNVNRTRIVRQVNKMEKILPEAEEYNFYNIAAFLINLGNLQLMLINKHSYEKEEKIEKFFLKAIDYKPDSQNARIGLSEYYRERKKISSVFKQLTFIKNIDYIKFMAQVISDEKMIYINEEDNDEILECLNYFEDVFYDDIYILVIFKMIRQDISVSLKQFLMYQKVVNDVISTIDNALIIAKTQEDISILEKLKFSFIGNSLLEICLFKDVTSTTNIFKLLNSLLEHETIRLDEYPLIKSSYLTNLIAFYINYDDFNKALETAKRKPSIEYNNADFSNLAFLYYFLGNYKKAEKYGKKAYATQVDEQVLLLLTSINYINENIPIAYEYALQSKLFLEKNNQDLTYLNNNEEISTSILRTNKTKSEYFDFLYKIIFKVLLESKSYIQANEFVDQLINQYPTNINYKLMKKDISYKIKNEKISKQEINYINKKNQKIKSELNKTIEVQQKMQSFIVKFGQIQEFNNNNLSEEKLNVFFEEAEKNIINSFKEQNEFKLNKKIKSSKREIKNDYKKFHINSIEQLAIADTLYEEFERAKLDYGSIAIMYGKVLEIELFKILKKLKIKSYIANGRNGKYKKIINNHRTLSLAEYRDIFKEYKIDELYKIEEMIEYIRIARNKAAHSGSCDLDTVEKIRYYMFEKKWLYKINKFLM